MIDSKHNVKRYITEYLDKTEELVAEYELVGFDLAKFQTEFNEPNSENPMLDCYQIKPGNIEFLKIYVENQPEWDFVNRSYFVECHAI